MPSRVVLLCIVLSSSARSQPITISHVVTPKDAAACEAELSVCLDYPKSWASESKSFSCTCWEDAYRCFSDCNEMPLDFLSRCTAVCPSDQYKRNPSCLPQFGSVSIHANNGGVSSSASAITPSLLLLLSALVAVTSVVVAP